MSRFSAFDEHPLQPLICGYEDLGAVRNHWNLEHLAAPYWRLYWHNKAGAAVLCGSQRVALHPGILVLIPPNVDFSTRNTGGTALRQLFIHFHLLSPSAAVAGEMLVLEADEPGPALVDRLVQLLRATPADAWALSFQVRALLHWVAAVSGPRMLEGSLLDPRILNIARYITEHLQEPLGSEELAREAGMSVNAFRMLFRDQLGRPLHAYVRLQRIEKACQLLHASDLSIEAVAAESGFYDRHHFTCVFTRLRGMGPARFRNLNTIDVPMQKSQRSQRRNTHRPKRRRPGRMASDSPYHSDT